MHDFKKDRTQKKHCYGLKKFKRFLLTLPFQTFIVSPVRAFVVTKVDFLSVAAESVDSY